MSPPESKPGPSEGKIWFDVCEPKTVVMLKALYEDLVERYEMLVTARDFDATYFLMDEWGIPYHKVGRHGGNTLAGKMRSYTERLAQLLDLVEGERIKCLFCLASPEALRLCFGLQIPNMVFNDEPRSVGVAKLSFPFADHLVVPECIPREWFTRLGAREGALHTFHGIDEVAWLQDFHPDPAPLAPLGVEPDQFIVARTEASTAQYLMTEMEEHESLLTEILPPILKSHPEQKLVVLARNAPQYQHLGQVFAAEVTAGRVQVHRHLDNLAHVMYHASLVITGGGTMVRESALLGVPSVEFFPFDTYPQEQFLIDNGFPLRHVKKPRAVVEACTEYLAGECKQDTTEQRRQLDNPVTVAREIFHATYE